MATYAITASCANSSGSGVNLTASVDVSTGVGGSLDDIVTSIRSALESELHDFVTANTTGGWTVHPSQASAQETGITRQVP